MAQSKEAIAETKSAQNGTVQAKSGEIVGELDLIVDVDNLSVDGFIQLLELQEEMEAGTVMARHVKGMIELLKPCVTNVDVGTLPYRHLQEVMSAVITELSESGSAAGN